MNNIILHSDLNCFYASVEINENPALRNKKVAVCGSTEDRHGIVLTASYPAKRAGVKTGMANWQAREACPDLICVPPHYDLYIRYGKTNSSLKVTVRFTPDDQAITVSYSQGYHEPFKVKSHLANRRALNAISDTLAHNGFTF